MRSSSRPTVASEVLRALVRDLDAQVRANGGHPSAIVRRVLFALHDAAQRAGDALEALYDRLAGPAPEA
ncbi:hypothetical protein [Streptomyces xantholiticus]|uniref:hypothetical protein n=1 Tax=Streptomyces xantholiticus TaxID=68285 RepID=UPI0016772EDB|nr:hypothetical protein [Streptomyces xantholiticus]